MSFSIRVTATDGTETQVCYRSMYDHIPRFIQLNAINTVHELDGAMLHWLNRKVHQVKRGVIVKE